MMKPFYFVFSLLILFSAATFAQSNRADSIKVLHEKINELQASVDRVNSMVQTSNGSIANSIAGSQHYLTAFTVLFSLLGIGIGLYINAIYNKIRESEEANEKILKASLNSRDETLLVQQKVQSLSDGITQNMQDIYLKLQNVEIKFILDRLIEAPDEFSLYWDKLNTNYKISAEMLVPFINMVKGLPQQTQAFGLSMLFKYFKIDELLKDTEISYILAGTTIDALHISDAKKLEIIDLLAIFHKTGNFNSSHETIIKKTLAAVNNKKPNILQTSIIKNFGESFAAEASQV